MSEKLEELAKEIKALTVPEQLRLAASLLERKRPDVAYTIIDRVRVELGAALAIRDLTRRDG